jgi:hypothetical protein
MPEDLFDIWAMEIQRLRLEHEATLKRETARSFQKGRQSAQRDPYAGWEWKGGKFCPPASSRPTEAL